MPDRPWIDSLLATIDARDPDAFAARLTPDGRFRWGSAPPVEGRAAVRDFVAGFFARFEALSHRLTGWWQVPGKRVVFAEGEVTYTLPGGMEVSVPFLNLLHLEHSGEVDGRQGKVVPLVRDYRIYADPTPLAEALG